MKIKENKKRSLFKSISWRLIAFLNSWIILTIFLSFPNIVNALFMNITGFILFYGFERIWNSIRYGKYIKKETKGMNRKILILGGAGYIGGYTTDYLINEDYDVTIYDKLVYETRYLKNVNFIYGDIRDTKKIVELSEDYEVIIIMAALVGDSACSIDLELTNEINYEAVKNICDNISNDKHIIFLSTCSVYGAQNEILDETSSTNPLSAYALTKLKAEQHITEKNGTIFRLGTVYGIGDTYSRIRLDLVVNVITMKSIFDGEINIFGGEQWRPLICIKDIAGYIEESINKNIRGTFILSQENTTMKLLGERIVKVIPKTKINYTNISFEDARNYKVSNKKLLENFKYRPLYTIESEVKNMIKIFKENRISDVKENTYNNGLFIKNKLKNKNNLKEI